MENTYFNILPPEILQIIINASHFDDILNLCPNNESDNNNTTCYQIKSYLINKYIGNYDFLMDLSSEELKKLLHMLYPNSKMLDKVVKYMLYGWEIDKKAPKGVNKKLQGIINRCIDLNVSVDDVVDTFRKFGLVSYEFETLKHLAQRGKLPDDIAQNRRLTLSWGDISSCLLYDGDPNLIYRYIYQSSLLNGNPYEPTSDVYKNIGMVNLLSYSFSNKPYKELLYSCQLPKLFFQKFSKYILVDDNDPLYIGYKSEEGDIKRYVSDVISSTNLVFDWNDFILVEAYNENIRKLWAIIMGYILRDNYDNNFAISILRMISENFYQKYMGGILYHIPFAFVYNIGNPILAREVFKLMEAKYINSDNISEYTMYRLADILIFNTDDDTIIKDIIISLAKQDLNLMKSLVNFVNLDINVSENNINQLNAIYLQSVNMFQY
ncbi:Hypothetical protein ORPV_1161 [Orpheovirus IHUMI-LCC2]|uniref:Uncharacterized protein n=1 Tax=Orpheovirus IHUMI-LCC2 TaxID=2023057 RepID=A0A2I2L688_9VIRU|nr:Hypothetical protein ORPV_1161 [Orpheovirus IHUMI-LCC2]SNW63065.1 Hypothetical protein ORPV_1161 [Orpheovirus IHUMI-LCC2]